MPSCAHVQWVGLDGFAPEWSLLEFDRLEAIINDLSDPQYQFPSLLYFIGKKSKSIALKGLYPENNPSRRKPHGIANLHLDLNSAQSQRPIIFADCTIKTGHGSPECRNFCHEQKRHFIHRTDANVNTLSMISYIQLNLLFPFTQVVCVFADDFGGNEGCTHYLENWLRLDCGDSAPRDFPRLVVVTSDAKDVDALVQLECHSRFHTVFDSLAVLTCGVSTYASDPNTQFFQAQLKGILDEVFDDRRTRHSLLNARHTATAFSHALQRFVRHPQNAISLFSCLSTQKISLTLADNLNDFFEVAVGLGPSPQMVSEFIASALLVQAYRPQSHYFPAPLVFDHFFRDQLVTYNFPTGYDGFTSIRAHFLDYFKLLKPGVPAVALRKKILKRHRPQWRLLRSTKKCFWCLERPTERSLPCAHSLCEECVQDYYPRSTGAYTYRIGECELCGVDALCEFSKIPITVEPNIAAIDGGGVRGLVALVLLKRLQTTLDTGHPVREYFDYFIGTSVGGLIVLDHVACGSSLDASIERFHNFADRIFPPKIYGFLSVCRRVVDWLVWWFSDNKYDSGTLEDVVQKEFGVRQRLFDFYSQPRTGTKIAVTTSTVSNSQLRLFTNYNGVARCRQGKGYAILRPPDHSGEPYLWEIARCAAAAPGFFRPKVLKNFGALQDGGLSDNNPTEKALWEMACVWPEYAWPHFVLSVGTGHQKPFNPDSGLYRGIWLDGFVPRILRAFLSSPSLDAENSWMALSNRLPHVVRERFHRLTVEFADELPELDDTSQIPRLIQAASSSHCDLDEVKRKLWASRLFFELCSTPERVRDYYVCRGTILCRFRDSRELLRAIRRYSIFPQIVLENKALVNLVEDGHICGECGYLSKEVTFEVPELGYQVAMELEYGKGKRNYLASFPKSIEWFVERQWKEGRWIQWQGGSACCEGRTKRRMAHQLRENAKRRRT